MIVDFQHHFEPRELAKETGTGAIGLRFDASGTPSMTPNPLLYDLDEHIRMMDYAGIEAAFLTCPSGMCADNDLCHFINTKTKEAERRYPGRFIGAAHVNPLGGADALRELSRCASELGFPGVVITAEFDGHFIDASELKPFWSEVCRLGLFVFIHPPLKLTFPQPLNAYDLARSVGREFSLINAVVRLIDSGLLDWQPTLTIHMSHLGGGIATMLGRIRKFQDREFFGTAAHPLHGKLPERDFDHYLQNRFVFDAAGMCGAISSVKASLIELPASRVVFATDYPQEIRSEQDVKAFIDDIRGLGAAGQQILHDNVSLLLGRQNRKINAPRDSAPHS
jgi:predicted TIM-barrel fold metal-dependent hydrolase